MSALKQRLARVGGSLALIASITAALLAIGGASASSAFAAGEGCEAGTITGTGSSLQKIAQEEVWIPHFLSTFCTPGSNEETFRPKYMSSGSGPGLLSWRFTGGTGGIEHETEYIGTDDAPKAAQITAARAAADEAHVVVVPVAQTAISVIVHPPSECSIAHITNANLQKAFSGEATTWSAIGGTGNGCSGTLTRVVRKEGSGTTFQFKNYLAKIKTSGGVESAPCAGQKKWSELEEIGASEEPNINWPECGNMAVERGTGGGGVAETVASMSGTIGYAALPDAKAKGAATVEVQNGTVLGSPTFAKPGTEEEELGAKGNANCAEASYTVPAEGLEATGTGLDVDWSGVFGGNPTIGGTTYPICTLTYILAWNSYETATFANGAATGTGVKHFVHDILTTLTLTEKKKWYAALPHPASEEHNVETAALFASGKIG